MNRITNDLENTINGPEVAKKAPTSQVQPTHYPTRSMKYSRDCYVSTNPIPGPILPWNLVQENPGLEYNFINNYGDSDETGTNVC